MKYPAILLVFLLLILTQGYTQSPVYYFNVNTDTAIESNAHVIAGYVKTNTAPISTDSVAIILRSGPPVPTHMDTTSIYMIHFSAGQDSVAFTLDIMRDTFPEYSEHVLYALTSPVGSSSIGTDSTLLFVLIDTTPPATINYVRDSGWAFLHSGTYTVCESVNNPNPFYVRFHTITHDAWYGYPGQSAYGGRDYLYDWDTIYAPPGISSYCEDITILPDTVSTPATKTFLCVIQNLYHDDNIITDSFEFTIVNDNGYDSPTVSFGASMLMVQPDTIIQVGIPISIYNPNHLPFTFSVDTGSFSSNFFFDTIAFNHFSFINTTFSPDSGSWTDTLWLLINKPIIISDTANVTLLIDGVRFNKSTDTSFHLIIINPDTTPIVSFYGAGLAHLKSDSIGYVSVYGSSVTKYPISVKVSYLNGNAIRDTDFIFDDTTITIPANTSDTISVPVIMLQDHRYQGNTQVNLQLTNVNPTYVQYGITQYTFTIIDDEDSGLTPLGVQPLANDVNIKVFPNPFTNEISISSPLPQYTISITNSLGQEIYHNDSQKGDLDLDLRGQSSGLYLLMVSDGDKTYIRKILKL